MTHDTSGNQTPQPETLFDLDRLRSGTEPEMTAALLQEYNRILSGSLGAALAYWRSRNPDDKLLDYELAFTIDEDSHPLEVATWIETVADEAILGIPGVADQAGSKYAIGIRQAFLKQFYEINASPDDPEINKLIREAATRREEYTLTLRLALDNHILFDRAHDLYLDIMYATQTHGSAGTDTTGHTIYIGRDGQTSLKQPWDDMFGLPHYRTSSSPENDTSNN